MIPNPRKPRFELPLVFLVVLISSLGAESSCSRGCDQALASYYLWEGANLTFIAEIFNTQINTISTFNGLASPDNIFAGTRLSIPFVCDCINGEFLAHEFTYAVRSGNTYDRVATLYYANLTTTSWLQRFNSYPPERIPDVNAFLNVTVNCSCGDESVSRDYGLFATYPLRPGETLASVATSPLRPGENVSLPEELIQRYNPNSNFSSGNGLVYIPARDQSGIYPPLRLSQAGISTGAIAGISVAAVIAVLIVAGCVYFGIFKRKKAKASLLRETAENISNHHQNASGTGPLLNRNLEVGSVVGGASPGLTGITVDKSVEFTYEELAQATDDFSLANKIGQGGFGAVYFAELRGKKAAIKKMDMQASKEFLAELKVLTNVHHLNLVGLIGYCVEGSLFLVYEFIENGNLSEHLRGSGREPLPWPTRVQIALDSARGLEYIHEHTVPVYIHRDIKSANILIDEKFHAKVADFGLAKLTEVGSSLQTRLVGTFGYMPPEYARLGDVSPKVDVYAFGVVLYELISAKEAIVRANGSGADSKGLVALFDGVLNNPEPTEEFRKLVDPRLGDTYPVDSVHKMALLAKACTHDNPQIRPSMRTIVVALMTLSSSTSDWDVGSFYENQALVNLMSGR